MSGLVRIMSRPALGLLVVILPLTLGLRSAGHGERIVDSRRLAIDAASKLKSGGWTVRSREHHLIGWLIEGARKDCRILVHFASPEGSTYEKFRQISEPIGPVTYQYRGDVSAEFPRITPMLAGHAQRYAWSFGLAVPTSPVLAVARSTPCTREFPILSGLEQRLEIPR